MLEDKRILKGGDKLTVEKGWEGLPPEYMEEAKKMQQMLYGSPEEQMDRQGRLKEGRELFEEKLEPEVQEAARDILKSGNPEAIEELFKRSFRVFSRHEGDLKVIEGAFDDFSRVGDFNKKHGLGSSESAVRVGNLIKNKLSETKQGN